MSDRLKIGAYVVLVGFAIWFAYGFFKNYSAATAARPVPTETTNEVAAVTTNQTDTAAQDTNIAASAITNAASGTNTVASTQTAVAPKPVRSRGRSTSAMMGYGAGFIIVVICLGLLVAHDFSKFAAHRFEKLVFDEDLEGAKDPEYEEAEEVWKSGKPLEAIQLMRDYLKAHPREQYVALRIAEIYEKDLGNFLAAALEYEEVLNKKLPPDRWGWAAIHLSNLYSGKLNKPDQSIALLQRIVAEYGQTPAAKKARERLIAEGIEIPDSVPPVEETPMESAPSSNLPPGFTPKKK
jgi:TolA-binding protein